MRVGSGNVFADIGLPNPEEHLIRAKLVYKIDSLMKNCGLEHVDFFWNRDSQIV